MHEFDSGKARHPFAGEMGGRAGPGRCEVDLAGLRLTSAMNSRSVFAGTFLLTAKISLMPAIGAIGTRSFNGLISGILYTRRLVVMWAPEATSSV
jgi:hypothetical protein